MIHIILADHLKKYKFAPVIIFLVFFLFVLFTALKAESDVYSNPVRYQANFSFVVINDSSIIDQLEVWLPKALEWDNQREIIIHRITPEVTVDTSDHEEKSGIYYWKFNNLPLKGNQIKLSVEFSFTAYETTFKVNPDLVKTYDQQSTLYKSFTKPEPFIQSDDKSIKFLAAEITAGDENPYLKARKIYDWILDNIDYQLVPGLKGATYALHNHHGECGDYAALFVALCRASGIPARPVIGMWANPFNEPHVWAEFYIQDIGWIPVDASQADGWGSVDRYFGHLDNNRIILSKGYNIILEPEIEIKSLPIFQLGAWWYEGEEKGVHEQIDVSISAPSHVIENTSNPHTFKKYGLEFATPEGWDITSIGGRGRYDLCLEILNQTRDGRAYLYCRKWRSEEPHRTPEQITQRDIEFFKKNSSKFVLLNHNAEAFKHLNGHGFLSIMTSFGFSDYFARYIYFTSDKYIYWLIFHSEEKNYMSNSSKFEELLNSLRLFNPEVILK